MESAVEGVDPLVGPRGATLQVVERIREAIIAGRLAPGSWLREAKLANQLRVSRIPVREALTRLEAEGLVKRVPYRGTIVERLTLDQVKESYMLRSVLEGFATKLATPHLTPEEIARLRSLVAQLKKCARSRRHEDADPLHRQFHAIIYNRCGSEKLIRWINELYNQFPKSLRHTARFEEPPEEYRRILDALRGFSSGMIHDALLMAGAEGGILGLHPIRGFEDVRIVGPATTILFGQPAPGAPRLTMYRAILTSAPGSILVIDGNGLANHFTGDNQGECAKRRGLLGTVVYGGARDVAGYRRMGMPLWCMGPGTADKPRGAAVVGHNVPITIGGVQVKPGDIIVADEDGVVAIPQELLGAVLENLKVITAVEEGMEKAIQRDAPIEELEAIIAKKKPKA